jgi:four helix bundle protein
MDYSSNSGVQKRAYQFALSVITIVDNLPVRGSAAVIGDQLLRSATSIGANIIEAQAASSRKDFKNFLNHALKSANETKYWLSLLRDSHKAESGTIAPALKEASEIANILGASIVTLKKKSE